MRPARQLPLRPLWRVAVCCALWGAGPSLAEVEEPAGAADPEQAPAIAVLRFDNPRTNLWWSVEGIRRAQDLLVSEIQSVDRYTVIDRVTLDARMQAERLLMPPGQLSPAGAVKLGRVLGIRYLVTGSLVEYGAGEKVGRRRLLGLRSGRDFTAELSLRVLDGTSGRLLWADSAAGVAAFDPRWADSDPAVVDAQLFDPLLAPLLRDLVRSMLAAEIEAPAPD